MNEISKRARGRPPLKPTPVPYPLVGEFFRLMVEKGLSAEEVSRRSGVSNAGISSWRTRTQPMVGNLEAVLNVLGYELHIRERVK